MRNLVLVSLFVATPLMAQSPSPSPRASASPTASATPAVAVATPSPSARDMVEKLADADVKQAIESLKSSYVDPVSVAPGNLDRALLEGLIQRLQPGASIILSSTAGKTVVEESPFRSEVLDDRIGYVRVGSIDAAHVTELDAALDGFSQKQLGAVILDLRASPQVLDFEVVADLARRFAPKGKVLFSLHGRDKKQDRTFTSNMDPKFQGILMVMIAADSAGGSEVIAQSLRQNAGAMVIGQRSSGKPAEFANIPLPSGNLLHVAVAEVEVPGAPSIYPEGVIPDLSVPVTEATQKEILAESVSKGIAPFVFETERARFNEAALVSGQNPDLDAMQASQQNKGKEKPKVLRDVALQRAVDVITSVEVYRAAGKKPPQTK